LQGIKASAIRLSTLYVGTGQLSGEKTMLFQISFLFALQNSSIEVNRIGTDSTLDVSVPE
jgi:hypothetical protein